MEVNILKEIAHNTRSKSSQQIVVSDDNTDFIKRFNPPLELDEDRGYEIALVNLETYYSFSNVSQKINRLDYSNGKTWDKVFIPEGSYEIKSLNKEIKRLLEEKGEKDNPIEITANRNTLKSVLTIKEGYEVSFVKKRSLKNLLGFRNKIYKSGTHESDDVVNILSVNSILIHLNIINGSYVNGVMSPVIYSFFPNVSPGYKIVEKPNNLVYLPVTMKTIRDLRVTITDQDNNILDLRDEVVVMRFHLREI